MGWLQEKRERNKELEEVERRYNSEMLAVACGMRYGERAPQKKERKKERERERERERETIINRNE